MITLSRGLRRVGGDYRWISSADIDRIQKRNSDIIKTLRIRTIYIGKEEGITEWRT